jgi:hypothetical protein
MGAVLPALLPGVVLARTAVRGEASHSGRWLPDSPGASGPDCDGVATTQRVGKRG